MADGWLVFGLGLFYNNSARDPHGPARLIFNLKRSNQI